MHMPTGTRTRRAGGTRRNDVLAAVVGVLAERGYENTRFADVSAASGVAISTLQNYFGSREDMLIESMRRATDLEVSALEAVAGAKSQPWNRLVALIDRNLTTPVTVHVLLIEFWRAGIRDSELRDYGEEVWRRYAEPFVRTVIEGCDAGEFTPSGNPEDIVELLLRSLAGAMFPEVLRFQARSESTFRTLLLEQLTAALGITDEVGA